jgi:hypothetical protein
MIRKKTPVALITVLIVAFVGLILSASKFGFYRKSKDEQIAELTSIMQKEEEAKRANEPATPVKVNASAETQKMKERLASSGNKGRPVGMEEENRMPATPSVLKPENKVFMPVPNEASTSSQWYK